MTFSKFKRNRKLETFIMAVVVLFVGFMTIIFIFTKPESEPTEQVTLTNSQEENQKKILNNQTAKTITPTDSPSKKKSNIDISNMNFSLKSNSVKNIEITSKSNGMCSEENGWQLKFTIGNRLANKQKKYAYQINPSHGIVFIEYDRGLNPSDFDNAINFYYREEHGNLSPILDDGITWMPAEDESIESIKLHVQVIDLASKNIESVFNVMINKKDDSYRITGIESAELVGADKEKAYKIALDYYINKKEILAIKEINESVAAVAPRTQNNLYYIDNVSYNGKEIGSVIVVYLNYNNENIELNMSHQGCFIVYLNKDTFEIIGEGRMRFAE